MTPYEQTQAINRLCALVTKKRKDVITREDLFREFPEPTNRGPVKECIKKHDEIQKIRKRARLAIRAQLRDVHGIAAQCKHDGIIVIIREGPAVDDYVVSTFVKLLKIPVGHLKNVEAIHKYSSSARKKGAECQAVLTHLIKSAYE